MIRYYRPVLILVLAALVVMLGAQMLLAGAVTQGADESSETFLWNAKWRGDGCYMALWKVICFWLVFLMWVSSTDWVSRDCQEVNLDWRRWNPIVFGSFLGTVLLMWIFPWFWLGFPLLLAGYVAPLTTYIIYRNHRVPSSQRVFTPDHLRFWFAQKIGKFGVKMPAEAFDPNATGAPVTVFALGGTDAATDAGRMVAARQSQGLPAAREILAAGLASRASAVMLDFAPSGVTVRYQVDGVWATAPARERETTDPALEALKLLCGLNPKERRARQAGKFGVDYCTIRPTIFAKVDKAEAEFREKTTVELTRKYSSEETTPQQLQQKVAREVEQRAREKFATPVGTWTPVDKEKLPKLPGIDPVNANAALEPMKVPATFASQGTPAGERVVIQFELKGTHFAKLEELGMRAKMHEQLKAELGRSKGFVLLSGPPAAGLRTTTKIVQLEMDRFMREFVAVENEANRYDEVENVPVTTYKGGAGESPAALFPKLFRNDPNVIVVRDLPDAETVSYLCGELSREERFVLSTMRARDCAEALLRVLALGVPPKDFAPQVTAVLCQRLLRKLCEKCKEAYAPSPQVLQQLGLPEGKVKAFFRPPQPRPTDEKKEEPCRHCGGSGYKGLTAMFELLVVDDMVRKVLCTSPKLDLVRQAARKAGMKTLQEEGILLAARGVTSVQELMRY